MEWGEFIAALVAFFAAHAVPSWPGLRRALAGLLTERGYLIGYSLVSIVLLGWVVVASGRAPFVELWAFEPWQMHVPSAVMPVVCVLLVYGLSSANPLSLGRKGLAFDPDRPGVAGVVRHPVLWAALLWALAHLVPNGDLAHVVVFGLFAALAVLGMVMLDRRARRRLGEAEWQRLAGATSNVPFVGLARRRIAPRPGMGDAVRIGVAAVVFALLVLAHPYVIGVSALPG